MKKTGNQLYAARVGQHGSMTQPADVTEVKQVTIVCSDFIRQCLELVLVKAVGEDGNGNLHDYRHDISNFGRLRVQGLLVNDALHFVDGLGVSGGLVVTRLQ